MQFVESFLPVSEINLASLDTFERDDFLGCFATLRKEAPISWHQHPDSGSKGFWAIVRYQDILDVILDTESFSSRDGIQAMFEDGVPRASRNSMLEMDPPEHSKYRKVVSPEFTPRALSKIESSIQARIDALLDKMAGKSDIDFVQDFATGLPMSVFFDLMGVSEADHERMLHLADRTFFSADPRFGGDQAGAAEAGREFQAYGRWLGEQRREEPTDDVMSVLAHSEIDGAPLTIDELGAFFGLLGSAGADTTRSSLANGLDALRLFPDQKTLWLQDIDGHAAGAADEIIRWASSVFHMRRTATRDVTLLGQEVKQGDKVVVWFVSGNRDEEVFDAPHRFDITRSPNPHMSFGLRGPHFCLGAPLARLQVRLAFSALLKRFPDIEAITPLQRLRGSFINGPASLPARLGNRS